MPAARTAPVASFALAVASTLVLARWRRARRRTREGPGEGRGGARARVTRFFLVRHGVSTWNIEGRIQGALDTPLSQEGIDDARRLGAILADSSFDVAVSSPLRRALDTCKAVCERQRPPLQPAVDQRLRERNFGDFQGTSKTDPGFKAFKRAEREALLVGDSTVKPRGASAETFEQVARRAEAALRDVAASTEAGRVLVVSHSNLIHSLTWTLSGLAYEDFMRRMPIRNCSVTELVLDRPSGTWTVDAFFRDAIGEGTSPQPGSVADSV